MAEGDNQVSPENGAGAAIMAPPPAVSTTSSATAAFVHHNMEKLQGQSNFCSWKFAIKMSLILEGLWECVTGVVTDAARDQRALARIALSLHPSLYQYITSCTTAMQAWEKLKTIFEDKGLYRRILLLRELHKASYADHAGMNAYIDHVMKLVQQLADIGKTIDDSEVAELLLSGLPQEFDTLVSNMSTASLTSTISSEFVRARLMQEESRKLATCSSETAFVSKAQFKAKKKFTCTYCHKEGHVKSKCFKLKRDKKQKEDSMPAAFLISQQDVYIDSGSSCHLFNDKNCFNSIKKRQSSVAVANSSKVQCQGTGDVKIRTLDKVLTLNNTLYVPQLSCNLISVSKLLQSGCDRVMFNSGGCFVYDKNDNLVCSASEVNGIYKLNELGKGMHKQEHSLFLQDRQDSPSAAVVAQRSDMSRWHSRLCHIGSGGMYALRDRVACGFMFQDGETLGQCVPCLEGKMAKSPFPKGGGTRATRPLELVHSDVVGPMPVSSLGGANFAVTFTDDYSRKSFCYLMKHKSEVCDHFIHFKNFVEKQTGLPILCLRSDNGKEYVNSRLSSYLKKEGIAHQLTVPYCPEQNSVAERLNLTLFNKVRCMLQEAGLGQCFWGEALMVATYVKNRSPTVALNGRIPEEVWTGSKVDLSHLRVFGCKAYALVPSVKRKKLDARSKQYIFVGYSETTKGYRLADPSDPRKVILSRDVKFLEDQFFTPQHSNNVPDSNSCDNNGMINLYNNELNIHSNNNLNVYNDNFIHGLQNHELNNSNFNDDISNEVMENNELNNNNENVSENNNSHVLSDEGNRSDFTDEWNTGSDQESSDDCSAGAVGEEPVTSPRAASSRGEGLAAESRPVRSTRAVPPKRYDDYDLSMLAQTVLEDEPQSYDEAMASRHRDEWLSSMKSEYNSLINNDVWKLVDRPKNRNVIKCKWVYRVKCDSSGNFQKYKARLVARGFTQKYGIDYTDTFSPVVRHSTMRLLFSLANEYDLNIDHIDVNTAFLNGELNETIYMEQPEGFHDDKNKDKVCLLQRSIYGLKQASRMWYCKVHDLLTKNNFKQSKCEPCVYYFKSDKEFIVISLYVDDFYILYRKDSSQIKSLLNLLESEFSIKNLGPIQNYLGIRVTRDRQKGILKLDQSVYIKKVLQRFGMSECKPVSTPMQTGLKLCNSDKPLNDETYNYRQLLGCLMYLSVCTRPDIAYACSQLSQYNNCFGLTHWLAAKRILRYLAGTIDYSLLFVKSSQLNLSAYADADFANDHNDRRSYTGFAIKLGENIVHWEARKQKCIALSSCESEYLALCDVTKDLCFIRNFLSEIFTELKLHSILVYNDNQSAHKLLTSKEYCHKRTKHIDIRYHFIKDLVETNFIVIKYLNTESMFADVLTKPLSKCKHVEFMHELHVRNKYP